MKSHQYSPISNLHDYIAMTNYENKWFTSDDELDDLKQSILGKELSCYSNLYNYLTNLSISGKAKLITALITNDAETIYSSLATYIEKIPNINVQKLKKITEHDGDERNSWFSKVVIKIIETICYIPGTYHLLDEGDIKTIFTLAMKSIPDTSISLEAKFSILFDLLVTNLNIIDSKNFSDLNIHYSYHEVAEKLKDNKYNGRITKEEFCTAIKYKKITNSELIVLTIGLFENIFSKNNKIKNTLIDIRKNYLFGNYEYVKKLLRHICAFYKNELGGDLASVILDGIARAAIDSVNECHSRRFFETRLAQFYFGNIDQVEFDSLDKFFNYFLKKNVTSLDDLNTALVAISELNPTDEQWDRFTWLKYKLDASFKESKRPKNGFIRKSDEEKNILKIKSNSIFSRNLGILTSNSPNMANELSVHDLRNQVTDIFAYAEDSYAKKRNQLPYVGSISGHACYQLMLLEEYAKIHQSDSNLSIVINNVIKIFSMHYIHCGYHSLHEILDIFMEGLTKKLFSQYNVVLDLNFSDQLLEKAFKDTQEYTIRLYLKKVAHEELQKNPSRLFATTQLSLDHEKMNWLQNKLTLAVNISQTFPPQSEKFSVLNTLLEKTHQKISFKDLIQELENIYLQEKNKAKEMPWSSKGVGETFIPLFINNNRGKYHLIRMVALILKESYVKYPECKNEHLYRSLEKIRDVNNYPLNKEKFTLANSHH